jgi:hypothetical protein
MKEVLSEMHGFLYERAIIKGMKEVRGDYYDFSNAEVKCWVKITEEGVKTEFFVYSKTFCDLKDYLYTTTSFKELR